MKRNGLNGLTLQQSLKDTYLEVNKIAWWEIVYVRYSKVVIYHIYQCRLQGMTKHVNPSVSMHYNTLQYLIN